MRLVGIRHYVLYEERLAFGRMREGLVGRELEILPTVLARRDWSSPTSVFERTCDDFPGSDAAPESKEYSTLPETARHSEFVVYAMSSEE